MNKTVYQDSTDTAIRISEFREFESETPFRGLGIKYVLSGEETYFLNGKKFIIKAGEYIIGNDLTLSCVNIKSSDTVKGVCVDLSARLISDIFSNQRDWAEDLRDSLLSDRFILNRHHARNDKVVQYMSRIYHSSNEGLLLEEITENQLLVSLGETIITEQRELNAHLQKLPFKKRETPREVLQSLLKAKSFMDEHLFDHPGLDEISLLAGISKFHFIRLFKSAFGISPHQYLKGKKLEAAKNLLRNKTPVSEVAYLTGYPDVQSFSKAFKQWYGLAPVQWQKSNF